MLLGGKRIVVIDEVGQYFDSDILKIMLTSEEYEDRILSVSKTGIVRPVDTQFIALGNNTIVAKDHTRRWLRVYLDPKCEEPHKRTFKRKPREHARENRDMIVLAAYTLLHAYFYAGKPDYGITLGSFERWSRLIAQTVVFSGFDNPIKTQDAWINTDLDRNVLAKLLDAWHGRFGFDMELCNGLTCGEVIKIVESAPNDSTNQDLIEAMEEVCWDSRKKEFNSRKLGNFIAGSAKRPVDGLRFEMAGLKKRAILWRVAKGDI